MQKQLFFSSYTINLNGIISAKNLINRMGKIMKFINLCIKLFQPKFFFIVNYLSHKGLNNYFKRFFK